MTRTRVSLDAPDLIYIGDAPDLLYAKTGSGIAYWRPEYCKGQMRLPHCTVDLGLPDVLHPWGANRHRVTFSVSLSRPMNFLAG